MRNRFLDSLWLYGSATVLTCLILMWVISAKTFSYNIPLSYSGDALFVATIFKSIMDTGQYVTNPYLGAPLIYNIADYPIYDVFNYAMIRFLALFSKDYAVVLNTFYFSTYLFVTWFSLFVFQRLGINRLFALVASLLFTFIPYHLMRGEGHLWVNIFFAAPIYVLLAFDVYNTQKTTGKKTRKEYLKNIGYLLLCIVAASSSAAGYFAFFGCYFLLVAGIIASIDHKKWYPLLKASVWVGVTGVVILINLAPDILSNYRYGHNMEVADRASFESENAGLKVIQLLLPIDNHRVQPLRIFKEKYNSTAPLVNENKTASLGIFGSIGFVILLLMVFVRRWAASKNTLFTLSLLNMSAVLLGTIGGLGAVFAYTISPTIRSYNRISVYVAFFALAAFFLALQYVLKRKSLDKSKIICGILAIVILVIGLLDQVPRYPAYENFSLKETYSNDQQFIKQIETLMPSDSMVFQLPYASFPESPEVNKLGEDELARAYLHSHTLHWSYGAIRGRSVTKWQQAVTRQPVAVMLRDIAFAGFTGLYINRTGYLDNGRALEKELDSLLHVKPVFSPNKQMVFYDMRSYVNELKKSMDSTTWQNGVNHVVFFTNMASKWFRGFYEFEPQKNLNTQWANSRGILIITNFQAQDIPVKLSFNLYSRNQSAKVSLSGDLIKEAVVATNTGTNVEKILMLSPGKHEIYFQTDVKKDMSKNINNWHFKVSQFALSPVSKL